jgi:hypothetical protein
MNVCVVAVFFRVICLTPFVKVFQGVLIVVYVFHVIPRTSDESPQSLASEMWMIQLHKELKNQGICLPER